MNIKGYIYTMFKGADPGEGWEMTDPFFGKGEVPTMGACRPDIRRMVEHDTVFNVIGRGRRMNEDQVELMRRWLSGMKTAS